MDDDSRMSETSSVRNRGQRRDVEAMSELGGSADAALASHIRPQLRCNACWEPILPDAQSAETCYRTNCGHLFCEKCAYKHFGQGRLQCPACNVDLSQARDGISETTIRGVADSKRTEAIWEEMMADPSACFEHFQQALDFVLFQLAQDSYRQEEIRRQQAEEQKAFQIQHGEKYIQLKNYTDQLEAELRETKSKMQTLTVSNDELREAYKEKSRKCRNWEKMCKTLKAQPNARQFPSPTRSTMGMPQQDGGALVAQTSQFSRPANRPMASRPYAVDASNSSMRNPMANMRRAETPRIIQRPSIGMFDQFARPQIGGPSRPSVQPLGGQRSRIMRPKTPLRASQRVGFLSKRSIFNAPRAGSLPAPRMTRVTKPIFSPGRAIQRARPQFELSAVGVEIDRKRPTKLPPKAVPTARPEHVIPFDFETILEAVDCSSVLGSSGNKVELTSLSEDLVVGPVASSSDETHLGRSISEGEINASARSSRSPLSLGPLKAPPPGFKKANCSYLARSAPRVAQRYQLRDPEELIAEASERRRISDEQMQILELQNLRKRKEEELARIYKREKEAEAERAQSPKVVRTYTAPKKPIAACDPQFTDELLQHK